MVLVLVVLGPAIEAAMIRMYKDLVHEVLVPRDFGLLFWVLLVYLGLNLAEGIVSFCDDYLSDWVGARFIVSLRTEVFRRLHGLSMSFFDRRQLGNVISRLPDDVEEIEDLMLSGMVSALSYTFRLLFFLGALSTSTGCWR